MVTIWAVYLSHAAISDKDSVVEAFSGLDSINDLLALLYQ